MERGDIVIAKPDLSEDWAYYGKPLRVLFGIGDGIVVCREVTTGAAHYIPDYFLLPYREVKADPIGEALAELFEVCPTIKPFLNPSELNAIAAALEAAMES